MPELPEVESLRQILARSAVGRTIVSARIGEARLRQRIVADFASAIAGRQIVRLSRRAKYLILELDGEHVMLVHLGMSGSLTHRGDGFIDAEFDPKHDHVEFALVRRADELHLVFALLPLLGDRTGGHASVEHRFHFRRHANRTLI